LIWNRFYYLGGADSVNEVKPSTAIYEDFNRDLENFLGSND